MEKLITFIVPTRNLAHLKAQFDHFERTTFDCSTIEFLIKVDSDHEGAASFLEEQVRLRPFKIRYISTPRIDGTFSLWIAVEQLFGMVDKSSYFVQILSDEPYFMTQDWDKVLQRYIGLFPDHVFRLRLSEVKFNNYASSYECAFRCDSFPIYTRRWLELTEGTGDCWGSDAYQQLIAFHLALGTGGYTNYYRLDSISRDIPVLDLKMGGLDFGVGVSPEMQKERHLRNLVEWNRLSTYKMQLHFSYLARRIFCYILATQSKLDAFHLVRDVASQSVKVVTPDGSVMHQRSYKMQRSIIFFQNITRNLRILYWVQLSPRATKVYHFLRLKWRRLRGYVFSIPKRVQLVLFEFTKAIIQLVSIVMMKFLRLFLLVSPRKWVPSQIKKKPFMQLLKAEFKSFMRAKYLSMREVFLKVFNKCRKSESLKVHGNEFLELNSPGISVLYKNKFKLAPGIRLPTEDEKRMALSIIDALQENRDKYRNMEFLVGELK